MMKKKHRVLRVAKEKGVEILSVLETKISNISVVEEGRGDSI